MNLKIGQILTSKDGGDSTKILEVFTNTASLSQADDFNIIRGIYSFKEIEDKFDHPKEEWSPKREENYYFIFGSDFEINEDRNTNSMIDQIRIDLKNCFRTKEEAEQMAEKFKELLAKGL